MVLDKIKDMLEKQLGIDKSKITEDSDIIKDIGADSLDIVEFLMDAENEWGITIEEEDGVGKIQVSGPNKESIDAAVSKIRAIVAIPEVGEVYDAKVISIMPYGCFVEFMPGKEGLLHISEIAWKRLETVEEAGIKEGDTIQVKLLEIDEKTGKFRLSHRVLEEKPEGWEERPARRPRREGREGREGGEGRPRRPQHRD